MNDDAGAALDEGKSGSRTNVNMLTNNDRSPAQEAEKSGGRPFHAILITNDAKAVPECVKSGGPSSFNTLTNNDSAQHKKRRRVSAGHVSTSRSTTALALQETRG
jgi:hypothetical protein